MLIGLHEPKWSYPLILGLSGLTVIIYHNNVN
jgi:hypothetical protein